MPWEETDQYIRSGHRSPDDFESDSLRTITISEEEGIKAVIGKPKGKDTTEVQSYLFAKDKGWDLEKAKAWFEEHKPVKEHVHAVLPFQVVEKIVDKPLKIRGVAMTAGMSRNFNIYTPEELQAFASKLVSAPVYLEHVSVDKAVGKVTKTEWDGQFLWYEAEIYESDVADKVRKGLVQHVSVGADYETLDIVDGKIPHGLHDAELSLVAVPGIPETNIQVLERLRESLRVKGPVKEKIQEQGDVSCVFCDNPADYVVSICQSCFDKLSSSPAGASAGQGTSRGIENMKPEELEKLVEEKVKERLKEQMGMLKCPKCGQTFDYYQWQSNNWTCPNKECGVEVVPPEPVLLQVRTQETPKDVVARAKNHYNKTDAEWDALSEEEKQQLIAGLPPLGTGRAQEQEGDREKARQEQQQRSQKYGIGVKDGGNVTKPDEYANIPDDEFADPVNYRYPVDKEHVQGALTYFNQPDNRTAGGYSHEEQVKIMAKIIDAALASEIEVSWQPEDPVYKDLPEELKAKLAGYQKENLEEQLTAVKQELDETKQKLATAEETIEQLKKGQSGNGSLLKNPPKTLPITEVISILEGLLPSPAVERSTLGMQRECQQIRQAIHTLKEQLKSGQGHD